MDKRTGFVKRPTFAELAALEKKVVHSRPIVRDATTYWNSYDAAWIKGPLDEVANQVFFFATDTTVHSDDGHEPI